MSHETTPTNAGDTDLPKPGSHLKAKIIGWVIFLTLAGVILYLFYAKKDDTTNIRAAARAYAKAMSTGDLKLLADTTAGDDSSLQALSAQARQNTAYERLTQAARKRYGDDRVVLAGRRAQDHVSNFFSKIDSEPVEVKGDEARLGYLWLKRTGRDWKVDRSRLVPPTPPGGDPLSHVGLVNALARAYNETADAIETNVVKDAEEARSMFLEKIETAVNSEVKPTPRRPATTRATSLPATQTFH